jgi:hypothetical protein
MIEGRAHASLYDVKIVWFAWRRGRVDRQEDYTEKNATEVPPGSLASVSEHATSDQADYAIKHTLVAEYSHEELATRIANGGHVE